MCIFLLPLGNGTRDQRVALLKALVLPVLISMVD
jgi:hypothetical protein